MSRAQWLEAARLYGAEFDYDEEVRRSNPDPGPSSKLAQFMAEQGNAAMLMLAAARADIHLKTKESDQDKSLQTTLLLDGEGFKLCKTPIDSSEGEGPKKIITPQEATAFIEADGGFELTAWQKIMDDLSMIHQSAF